MSDVEKLADVLRGVVHELTYANVHADWARKSIARTILASDWLRERDGTNRILGAIRLVEDADEAYTALVAGVEALANEMERGRWPTSPRGGVVRDLRALIGEPVDAEHVPGCNPGCDETGHVLGDGS